MILLAAPALEALIDGYPGLTRERRAFMVDYVIDTEPAHIPEVLDILPAEERAFVLACFGETDVPPSFASLQQTEKPLMPQKS
jgi:hypothetical protein